MLTGKYLEFTLKDVFVGRQVGQSYLLLNYLFILAKLHISDILKFELGSEAWGNKTKEITSRLRE